MFSNKSFLYFVFAIIFATAIFYPGDEEYLQKRSADKTWEEFLPTLNQIVRKGDYLKYQSPSVDNSNPKWSQYIERYSFHIGVTNKLNSPKMRKTFTLTTQFRNFNDKTSVEFAVYDDNTNDLIERKIVLSQPIKWYGLIPALLAFFLSLITFKPIVSLLIACVVGSAFASNYSFFSGLWALLTNYIPESLFGTNFSCFYILIFILSMHLLISALAYSGAIKSIANIKGFFKKYAPTILFSSHPFYFITLGGWWFNSQSKKSAIKIHIFALIIPLLFLISPFLIYIFLKLNEHLANHDILLGLRDIYLNIVEYRFFSFTLIIAVIVVIVTKSWDPFNKELAKNTNFYDTEFFKSKHMVKTNIRNTFLTMIVFFVSFYFFIFISGLLNYEYNNNIRALLNLADIFHGFTDKTKLLTYVVSSNVEISLMLSSLFTLIIGLALIINANLTPKKELFKNSVNVLRENLNFYIIFILSFTLTNILDDLGSIYYIVSLFKSQINPMFFPLISFILASLTGVCIGNSIAVISYIPIILIPVAYQIGGQTAVMLTITAVIEGSILGELICPYSPSTILVSSLYKINPSKYVMLNIKIISVCFIVACVFGFLLAGINTPFWASYVIITLIALIIFYSRKYNKI